MAASTVTSIDAELRPGVRLGKPRTFWGMALRSLQQDKASIFAIMVLALMGLLAIFAGVITAASGVNPLATNPANQFSPPYICLLYTSPSPRD